MFPCLLLIAVLTPGQAPVPATTWAPAQPTYGATTLYLGGTNASWPARAMPHSVATFSAVSAIESTP